MELKLIALFIMIAGFIIGALVRNFIRSSNESVDVMEQQNQLEQLNRQLAAQAEQIARQQEQIRQQEVTIARQEQLIASLRK